MRVKGFGWSGWPVLNRRPLDPQTYHRHMTLRGLVRFSLAMSLASAIDKEPANSQLIIQYRQTLVALRGDAARAEDVAADRIMRELSNYGCALHSNAPTHCAECCPA